MDCCEEKARSSPAWGIRLLDHIHRRAGSYAIADIPLQDPAQHMMLVNIDRIAMHGTLPSPAGSGCVDASFPRHGHGDAEAA